FRLTVTIAESSGRSLPGIAVDILSGIGTGLHPTTNAQAQYTFYGVAGQVQMRASGTGFSPQVHEFFVADDSTQIFTLAPLEPPADVSGVWTMTLSPSPSCRSGLPTIARERSYQVQFFQQG